MWVANCPGRNARSTARRAPIASARVMNERYFARRLMEELQAAERAVSTRERSGHLRACYLLCTLLGLNVAERRALARRRRR